VEWKNRCYLTQCGKTFIDISYVVPERIISRKGQPGLNLILGVTKETIERNVLEPMRDFWGSSLVGEINSRNIARLFGEKVYCLGAEKITQVSKLRGAKFKYVYCDEIVDYNKEVFELLKSRLSLDYSVCDFTGNPSYPDHYIKKFIDSDVDVYCQSWTIFDNPFLSPRIVDELKREYQGSVYYDRYILGKWQRAEGIIYKSFADNPDLFTTDKIPQLSDITVGIDFGGTKSSHAFVASGHTAGYKEMYALMSERHNAENTTPSQIDKMSCDFVEKVIKKYGFVSHVFWDCEASVLGRGITKAINKQFPSVSVRPCIKPLIKDRIDLECRLIGLNRFFITNDCQTLKEALCNAVWNEEEEDERLDDGTSDIDSLDSWEYSFTERMRNYIY